MIEEGVGDDDIDIDIDRDRDRDIEMDKQTYTQSLPRSLTYLFTSINNNNMFIAHTRIYPLLPFNSHYFLFLFLFLFLFFPTHLGFNGDFD